MGSRRRLDRAMVQGAHVGGLRFGAMGIFADFSSFSRAHPPRAGGFHMLHRARSRQQLMMGAALGDHA